MCRWFAYISNSEPCLLEDVLIIPAHSLSKQVHDRYLPYLSHYEPDSTKKLTKAEIGTRNSPYNMDGLGMGWYSMARAEYGECDGPHAAVYKVLRQPMSDPIYRSICANTATKTVFAHIRAASGDTAVTEYNCHPFQFGRWVFMHNGAVAHFNEIRREMEMAVSDEALQLVKGTTDSEHLAALFFTYLEQSRGAAAWETSHPLRDVKDALEQTIAKILQIQKEVRARTGGKVESSSLNCAVTDGTQLLAIRFRNHPTEHPPSLYFSTTAGASLNRKYPGHPDGPEGGKENLKDESEHGDHVIVASEPSTYNEKDWELIKKNQCLIVTSDMVVRHEPIEVSF